MKTESTRRLIFYYALLALVIVKTLWGIQSVRDLTYGDTSSYFIAAQGFATKGTCNFCWSPLYTSFLGSVYRMCGDPYVAVILHRVLIVGTVAVLIFELGRRLLSAEMALLISCWWVLLPINHAALYEIHVFAAIPILLFLLLVANSPTPQSRAIATAVLLTSTVLLRNEALISLLIFGTMSVLYDAWKSIQASSTPRLRQLTGIYGVPLAVAAALIALAYFNSTVRFPQLADAFRAKQSLNVGQIYAFGYGQRDPSYTDNPWTDYQPLMRETFGSDRVTFGEACARNPSAMVDHFLWNAKLIPAGLQVGLFNARTGGNNPDYAPTTQAPVLVGVATAVFLAVITAGFCLMWRNRREHQCSEGDLWFVVAALAVAANVAFVMIMQRPRPSYLFPLTMSLMLLFGRCLETIFESLGLRGGLRAAAVAIVGLALVCVPGYYTDGWLKLDPSRPQQRPVYELLRVMQDVQREQPEFLESAVAIPGYTFEMWSYLARGVEPNRFLDSTQLISGAKAEASSLSQYRDQGVQMVVLAPWQTHLPFYGRFVDNALDSGWSRRSVSIDGKEFTILWIAPVKP